MNKTIFLIWELRKVCQTVTAQQRHYLNQGGDSVLSSTGGAWTEELPLWVRELGYGACAALLTPLAPNRPHSLGPPSLHLSDKELALT